MVYTGFVYFSKKKKKKRVMYILKRHGNTWEFKWYQAIWFLSNKIKDALKYVWRWQDA
jgi:hypothetical protein